MYSFFYPYNRCLSALINVNSTMSNSEIMMCNACKNTDLREYHGDLTCIKCGLVKFTHMIDDSCNDNYNETDYCMDYYTSVPIKRVTTKTFLFQASKEETQDRMFKNVLDILCLDDKVNELALEWFGYTKELKVTPKKMVYIYGVCIYCASIYNQRGISIQFIANKLQISHTTIYKFLPKVLELWSTKPWYKSLTMKLSTHTDKLTRMLYNLSCIPSKQAFQVLKPSRNLYNKINNFPGLNAVKSYTLIACCIYIGASIVGVKIPKSQFCKEVGISMPTLKSHEITIQNALIEINRKKG